MRYSEHWSLYRGSHSGVFCKEGVLRNFATFTGKNLYQSFFFNKVAGLRIPFLIDHLCWLFLQRHIQNPVKHLRWSFKQRWQKLHLNCLAGFWYAPESEQHLGKIFEGTISASSQSPFTCFRLATETVEQSVKYVPSWQ